MMILAYAIHQAFSETQYSSGAHDIAMMLMRWAAAWGVLRGWP